MKFCWLTLLFSVLINLNPVFSQAPNDDCINATLLQLDQDGVACMNTNNNAATADGYSDVCDAGATPPLSPGGNEVWFTYVTSGDSNSINVSPGLAPQIVDPSITVLTGDCNSMTTLVCNAGLSSAEVNFNLPPGTMVWFSVTALTSDGNFSVCVISVNSIVSGGGDCIAATQICNKLPFLSTDLNPQGIGLIPSCFPGQPVHPLWYTFTVGSTGTLEFTGQPTGFPNNGPCVHWALYEATDPADACNNPSLIMCNANCIPGSLPVTEFGMSSAVSGCTGSSFCPSVQVDSGKTYLLLLDNTSSDPDGFTLWWDGNFELSTTADFTVSTNNACEGELVEVTYTGNATANAVFNWNPPQPPNTLNFDATFSTTGKNYITLVVSENGCTDYHLEEVNVFPVPAANAGSDVSFCDSGLIGAAPVAGYDYSWLPSINLSAPDQSQTTVSGNNVQPFDSIINYILIVSDGICSDSDSVVVTVIPKQSAVFLPPPDQCVNNNSYAFNLLYDSVPDATFNWSFQNGDPLSSSLAEPSGIHFDSVGQFTVTLIAQSPGCPADTSSDVVTIHTIPSVSFVADVTTGCPPLTVNLFNTSPPLAGGTLTWNAGNGTMDTLSGDTATVTFDFSGIYIPTLTITSPDGCAATDTLNTPIEVLDLPDATFYVTPVTIEDIYPFAEFVNTEFNGLCFYSFGDGDSSYDCQTDHLFDGTGVYPVQLIVIGTNGCIDTSLQMIEVKKFATLYIPSAFSPNDDGRNDTFIVRGDGMTDLDIQIFNRRGQRVFRSGDLNLHWNGNHLDTGKPVPDGVYVYEIRTLDENRKKHYYAGHITVVR